MTLENNFKIHIETQDLPVRNMIDYALISNSQEEYFTNLHSCQENDSDSESDSSPSNRRKSIRNMCVTDSYHFKSVDDVYRWIENDAYNFICKSVSKQKINYTQCRLICENSGLFQRFHFEIELETDEKPICLLTAEKQMKVFGQSYYLISLDSRFHQKNVYSAEFLCNNLAGTSYTLYDINNNQRQPLAIISYEANFLGLKGPRKLEILLPRFDNQMQPLMKDDEIDEFCSEEFNDNFVHLHSKRPIWSDETYTYILSFEGQNRVTIPSIKNFRIVAESKDRNSTNNEQNIMQFGRMTENIYSCDFRYPLSFIQAFSIGLSALETRLFRE